MLTYNNVKQFIFYWLNCKFAAYITNFQDLRSEHFMAYRQLFLINMLLLLFQYTGPAALILENLKFKSHEQIEKAMLFPSAFVVHCKLKAVLHLEELRLLLFSFVWPKKRGKKTLFITIWVSSYLTLARLAPLWLFKGIYYIRNLFY